MASHRTFPCRRTGIAVLFLFWVSFLPSFFLCFVSCCHSQQNHHSFTGRMGKKKKNSQRIPWHVSTRFFVWRGTHVEQQKQQRQHQNEGNMAVRGYRKAGQGWAKQGRPTVHTLKQSTTTYRERELKGIVAAAVQHHHPPQRHIVCVLCREGVSM